MDGMDQELPDEAALAAFASKLEAYATTSSERERRMLLALVLAATDPVERVRWLAPADLLSDREEAYLHALAAEQKEAQ